MDKYYHEPDIGAFQHQIVAISKEMKFRLNELIDASRKALLIFHENVRKTTSSTQESEDVVRYRFSSVLALLQTFRDALPRAIGKDTNLKDLTNGVPHAKLLRQLRNSLVHEGYQPFGLWVDGRYYMGTNYIAHDPRGNSIQVDAPEIDIETLALEYSSAYCAQLANFLEALPSEKKLKGPARSYEWFQATLCHPVLRRFS